MKYGVKLNDKGMSLDFTGDYYNYNYKQNYGDGISSMKDESATDMWKFDAKYKLPVKKVRIEAGVSAQLIETEYRPCGENATGVASTTSSFMPIAFITVMGQYKDLQYSIGTNYQHNRAEYKLYDTGEKIVKKQNSINPTVQLMYPLNKTKGHAFMFFYKRMLENIPYSLMSSRIVQTDKYNYSVGNPNLVAPSHNYIMAGVSLFQNKLNINGVFTYSNNVIHYVTLPDEENTELFYTQPENLSKSIGGGLTAEINLKPAKFWQTKLNGSVTLFKENDVIEGIRFDKVNPRCYFSVYNDFNFGKGWGGTLTASCEPTFHNYDRTYYAVYDVSGSVYKSMCNKRLLLSASFTALGKRRKLLQELSSYNIENKINTKVQHVMVSLTWNFNGGKRVNVDRVNGTQSYQELKDTK